MDKQSNMNFFRNPSGLLHCTRKQVQVFYLSFSFCSFSFLSFSALASSASCFLMSSSTSFCLRTLILVLPFSRVSVAISTAKIDRKREGTQSDVCPCYGSQPSTVWLWLPIFLKISSVFSRRFLGELPL